MVNFFVCFTHVCHIRNNGYGCIINLPKVSMYHCIDMVTPTLFKISMNEIYQINKSKTFDISNILYGEFSSG